MNIKKSLKDVIVLVCICAVFAVALAATNSITAPIIADRLNAAAGEAYMEVMPGSSGFESVDMSEYTLPSTVKEVMRETGGMGHAIKVEVTGYKPGLILIIGVSSDGVVTGSKCIASNETWGLENTLGDKVVGTNADTIVDVEAGVTSLTVNAYRNAVKDAINAATILGGGSVDIRTPEQILNDNLNSALGLTDSEFTKMFMVEIVEGITAVYTENNGAGYVVVIDGKYVGVNADGVAVKVFDGETVEVTEGVDALKTSAQDAYAIVSATETTEIDLTAFDGIHARVQSAAVTATGNYMFTIKCDGFGVHGDHYFNPSGEDYYIQVSISADGIVIDSQTISHSETPTFGGLQLVDGAFNSNFIGKGEADANGVDTVTECTLTTKAYKNGVLRAFEAFTIITTTGGAE